MKQIFTLLTFVFIAVNASAQFSENFENYSTLSPNCWQLTSTHNVTGSLVINGAASIGTDPAVASEIKTPYLSFAGTSNVSFKYRLNNKLNQNATRTVEVGTTDKNGTFTLAASFTLNRNTSFSSTFIFNENLSLATGTHRFTIRVNTLNGDGNSFLIIDDLSISSATLHYGANPCNTAPVASDAIYAAAGYAPFNGDLRTKASDANTGEVLTFTVVTFSEAYGTLVLNSDGTFVFTPSGGFTGGTVVFTYRVTDNGYDPLSSNTATVSITYPSQTPLPVSIASFSGNVVNNKAQLSWIVMQNEDGNYFQVEKSNDGKTFSTAAVVMNTVKTGSKTYSHTDAAFSGTTYYRLKVVNKYTSVSYSKTAVLKETGDPKKSNLTILQNPVTSSSIRFQYNAYTSGTGTINLYNHAGMKVSTTQMAMHKGGNVYALHIDSRVPLGTYVMEIVNGAERSIAKLIKQ